MAIPLRNVYYLLCYAWDHLEARDIVPVGAELGDRTENLLAHVLLEGVRRLCRQGLDHGYIGHEVELAGIRGKLLVGETVKRRLPPAGRTACVVDELTSDVPHNRLVKASMRTLAALDTVDLQLRGQLHRQLRYFASVSDVTLDQPAFRSVQLHRNIARYGFLLELCALLFRCLVPDPQSGERRFHPFTASDQAMGNLFEDFLFNFFRREQDQMTVQRRHFDWDAEAEEPEHLQWLPEMRTDVLLTSPYRRVVLEAKFYRQPVTRHGSGGRPKLIASHLYQLTSYLNRLDEPGVPRPEGLLVYAGAGEQFDLRYRLAGHAVRVVTLDLSQPWTAISQAVHRLLRHA